MKKRNKIILLLILPILVFGFIWGTSGATNFDRLVLGEANYGEDPNTTADITGQNDEYWSNYTNGRWDAGSADIYTTGSLNIAGITMTGAIATITNITMTGDLLGADSVKARTLYLTEAIGNVTNITMTGDLLGADSIKGRTLYLTEAIANVTNITMTGDLLGVDSTRIRTINLAEVLTVGNTMAGIGTFGQGADEVQYFIDTVTVAGLTDADIVVVTPLVTATTDTTTHLGVKCETGQFVVFRNDTLKENQTYNWIRLDK